MTDNPRQKLRDLIAARLAAEPCPHAIGPGHHGCTAACADCMADRVMELFPDVTELRENHSGSLALPVDGPGWTSSAPVTHTRLVLSTAPAPTGTPARDLEEVARIVRRELADLLKLDKTARRR